MEEERRSEFAELLRELQDEFYYQLYRSFAIPKHLLHADHYAKDHISVDITGLVRDDQAEITQMAHESSDHHRSQRLLGSGNQSDLQDSSG